MYIYRRVFAHEYAEIFQIQAFLGPIPAAELYNVLVVVAELGWPEIHRDTRDNLRAQPRREGFYQRHGEMNDVDGHESWMQFLNQVWID